MKSYTLSPKKQQAKESPLPAPGSSEVGAGIVAPLPCLFSNNSIDGVESPPEREQLDTVLALSCLLSPYRKRQAHTLFSNVHRLIEKEAPSINHVGFLTLTFPDNVTDPKEAYDKYRSMNTNFLSKWDAVKDWICVKERQARGAWHYHLVVVFNGDIRTGVNFEEIAAGDYKSAGRYLRDLWSELRARLPEYGFGRSELLPVRSNAEAMGRYIGKYISKHMGQRKDEDKGVRLVNYSKGWARNSIRFAWHSKNASEWRRKLKKFSDYVGCSEFYQLNEKLGPCWAYKYADDIMNIDFTLFENGGEVSQVYKEKHISRVEQNQEYKEHQAERELHYSPIEMKMHKFRSDKEKLSKKDVQAGKIVSGFILNQKWYTSEENIDRVKEEVRCDMEESALVEAKRVNDCLIRRKEGLAFIVSMGQDEISFDRKIKGVPF